MINIKIKLYLDFDDTIVNSSKAFIEVADKYYGTKANKEHTARWDYRDLYPTMTEDLLENIFSSNKFFNNISFLDNSDKVLYDLRDQLDLTIVTKGSAVNLLAKKRWLDKNITWTKHKFIGVENSKCCIDLRDGIFIDDNIKYVREVLCDVKILLKNNVETDYNQIRPNETCYVCNDWKEISDFLKFTIKNKDVMFNV